MSARGEAPDQAKGRLTCRPCGKDFIVIGGRDPNVHPMMTPLVELLACPHCKTARRMMLPVGVTPPIVRVEAVE